MPDRTWAWGAGFSFPLLACLQGCPGALEKEAASDSGVCVSDIAEVECDTEPGVEFFHCDRCEQVWDCSSVGWGISDVSCDCITPAGGRDTAIEACRETFR